MKEKQRKEALRRMEEMKVNKLIINHFEEGNIVLCEKVDIPFAPGFYIGMNKIEGPLLKEIRKLEEEYGIMVYIATYTYTGVGELIDLIYVSKYAEEWGMDEELMKDNIVMSYCINQTIPDFSEFGSIGIAVEKGRIYRTC